MIPDGITPVSAWRCWNWNGTRLTSLNGWSGWEPQKAAHATCGATTLQPAHHMSLSYLRAFEDPNRYGAPMNMSGSVSMMQQPGVPRRLSDRAKYDAIRFSQRRPAHASPSHAEFLPSVYDEDKGEHFIPFGQSSRILLSKPIEQTKDIPVSVPAGSCSCGIYAGTSLKSIEHYAHQSQIIGRVALWGRTIVADQGYRAEFAYPQAFYTAGKIAGLEAYGVPILSLSELNGRGPEVTEAAHPGASIGVAKGTKAPFWTQPFGKK